MGSWQHHLSTARRPVGGSLTFHPAATVAEQCVSISEPVRADKACTQQTAGLAYKSTASAASKCSIVMGTQDLHNNTASTMLKACVQRLRDGLETQCDSKRRVAKIQPSTMIAAPDMHQQATQAF